MHNETEKTQDFDHEHKHEGCPFMNAVYKIESEVKESFHRNDEHHDSPFYDPSEIQETDTWVEEALAGSGVPTAMFHGFGDACVNPGDI